MLRDVAGTLGENPLRSSAHSDGGRSILHASGAVEIELPRWLLAGTFAAPGWGIGLRFTRSGLAHAARCFPPILASIAVLIAFCGMVALICIAWSRPSS